jgi:8-oxo-dGTP pyrophosphatase MutT (NUDIX family)
MNQDQDRLLDDSDALVRRIGDVLFEAMQSGAGRIPEIGESFASSSVLFLLGRQRTKAGRVETCLILNKRSRKVPQAGDLCCPGGGIAPRLDRWLSRVVRVPGLPLRRWPHYRAWKRGCAMDGRDVQLLLAAALREGYEEMGLRPFGMTFLGLLPPQRLRLLRRAIQPAVVWMDWPQSFRPNWEVEKVVIIPLRDLLDPGRYARFRLRFETEAPERLRDDFGCFRLEGDEVLWGATHFITLRFLSLVFGFEPPALDDLPVVYGTLDEAYMAGRAPE